MMKVHKIFIYNGLVWNRLRILVKIIIIIEVSIIALQIIEYFNNYLYNF